MYYTGFADEAASDIDGQIKATKALGWKNIEARNISGQNIHNLPEEDFQHVAEKLSNENVQINCFGSTVANWSKDPTTPEGIHTSIEELERALIRMKQLGTKMIRGMSYKVMNDRSPYDKEIEKVVLKNLKDLVRRCEDAGVLYVHENCMNYGGQSYEHSLKLIKSMNSPNFKLIFDTGNPPVSDLRLGNVPYQKQDSWTFYKNMREHIHYIHIKDAIFVSPPEGGGLFPKSRFTFPGEGDGDVKRIVNDLIKNGYDGGFSIEPHMKVVFHEDADQELVKDTRIKNYVEYGKRFMKIVDEALVANHT